MKNILGVLAILLTAFLGGCGGDGGAECESEGQKVGESCKECPCANGLSCEQLEGVCVAPR